MSRKRYEDEIDEILKKLDGTLPSKPLSQRAREKLQELAGVVGPVFSGIFSAIQPGHLMLLSLALMLVAYVLPGSGWRSNVGILGLALFIVALVLSILERRRPRYEPRWRGRVIRYKQSRLPDWLRRFLGRR